MVIAENKYVCLKSSQNNSKSIRRDWARIKQCPLPLPLQFKTYPSPTEFSKKSNQSNNSPFAKTKEIPKAPPIEPNIFLSENQVVDILTYISVNYEIKFIFIRSNFIYF